MRFLRLREVQNRVPYGRATIYRKIAAGEFPKPYEMATRSDGQRSAVAWLESEVDEWIASRIEARKGSQKESAVAA